MDPEVIKAALDSFENDDFLQSKDLLRGQIKKAKNDFLKAKLGLKNDIEQQFVEVKPVEEEPEEIVEPEVKPKKRLIPKKKKM